MSEVDFRSTSESPTFSHEYLTPPSSDFTMVGSEKTRSITPRQRTRHGDRYRFKSITRFQNVVRSSFSVKTKILRMFTSSLSYHIFASVFDVSMRTMLTFTFSTRHKKGEKFNRKSPVPDPLTLTSSNRLSELDPFEPLTRAVSTVESTDYDTPIRMTL